MTTEIANNGRAYVPVDDARWQRFIEAVRLTGSLIHSARLASPHCSGPRGGLSSFKAAMARDPRKAAEYDEAMDEFAESVEQEVTRRAFGFEKPLVYRGRVSYRENPETGRMEPETVPEYDTACLLALARARLPDRFASQTVRHEGKIQHQHAHMVVLDPADVVFLSPDQRRAVLDAVRTIREAKGEDVAALPAPVDAEYEEVGAEDPYAVPAGGF